MIINYLGHSCFKLEGKETPAVLIMDPFDKSIGLKVPKMNADIITVSHSHNDHNNISDIKGITNNPFIVNIPGEYEIKGVLIYGIPSFHDKKMGAERGENTIFRIELDGISIAHLGDIGHIPNNAVLEKLEGIDILLIPVGGIYTINAKEANEIISRIEPRIAIPMHYKVKGIDLDIDTVDPFLKEMGVSKTEIENKLKISKKDLPQGTMQVVVMG
ncbi:MAG: MBL fold metallo-hydrolase [bacterium]